MKEQMIDKIKLILENLNIEFEALQNKCYNFTKNPTERNRKLYLEQSAKFNAIKSKLNSAIKNIYIKPILEDGKIKNEIEKEIRELEHYNYLLEIVGSSRDKEKDEKIEELNNVLKIISEVLSNGKENS